MPKVQTINLAKVETPFLPPSGDSTFWMHPFTLSPSSPTIVFVLPDYNSLKGVSVQVVWTVDSKLLELFGYLSNSLDFDINFNMSSGMLPDVAVFSYKGRKYFVSEYNAIGNYSQNQVCRLYLHYFGSSSVKLGICANKLKSFDDKSFKDGLNMLFKGT